MPLLTRSYQLLSSAAVILASADGESPRLRLRALVQDEGADSFQRLLAIEACADFPRPGDATSIRHFLESSADTGLKERVIYALGKYSYQDAVPVLRGVLAADGSHPQLINAEVFTMAKLYNEDSLPSVENLEADLAILRAVADRPGVSEVTRAEIARLLQLRRSAPKTR
jgi:hypothetical protein